LLVVHEAMHWLERCSGKGIDFDHADDGVWQHARLEAQRTVMASLEERARGRSRHPLWSQRFIGKKKVASRDTKGTRTP
jgi:hypothetical protein